MEPDGLYFKDQVEDVRGKILFLTFGELKINVVEIKKGYSRGGHYHTFPTQYMFISGRAEYKGKNVVNGFEVTRVLSPPNSYVVPENEAHLVTAIDDVAFLEISENGFEATTYPEFRNIVEQKMKTSM